MDIDMTALRMLEHERELPLDLLIEAIEQALHSAYLRTPDAYHSARVVVDRKSGHVTVLAREEILTEVDASLDKADAILAVAA